MEKLTSRAARQCSCTRRMPGPYTLKSPEFYKETAIRATRLPYSGTETWDFCVEELRDRYTGELLDWNGKPFGFRSDAAHDVAAYDGSIREDHARHVNRIKEKARECWNGKNRLQNRMIYSLMILWFALESFDCRTKGECAHRNSPAR